MVSAAISAGPRDRSQVWSRAIHDHYPDIDGLYYSSSDHPPSGCVALSERAADALTTPTLMRLLDDPGLRPFLEVSAEDLDWPLV